jgi:sugar/nucleoside kinase (ribokinase family)
MSSEVYDVVYIGNYTKDTIISPAGVKYVDGGGACYAAYAASRLGRNVAIVTHLAREDVHVVEDLKRAGIDCYPTYTHQSTRMNLEYPTTNPDIRNLTVGGTAGSITVSEVENLEMKSAVIGSSLRGEVGLDVLQKLHEKKVTTSADMQGFIRVLHGRELKNEPWEQMQETLAYVDILKSDTVEAEFLTGKTDIHEAARVYASMGPTEIVLTHKDGLLIFASGVFHELEFHPSRLDGRSGRGDTCIGTYVAMRQSKPPLEAGIWAAAVTSLKMEDLGPFNRSVCEVEALIREKYNHGSDR